MRREICYVVAALAAAACGGGGATPSPDGTVERPKGPSGFTFAAIGDRSFASFGWTGLVHNVRVPDGTPFGVIADNCQSTDGLCAFHGPADPDSPVQRRRCLNLMHLTCATDNDCPNDGTPFKKCVYIYDPPTAVPLTGMGGKVGACGFSYIPIAAAGTTPTVVGTLDQTSGELNIQNLTIILPQNGTAGTYRGACAECVGDAIANDGVRDGTCVSATHGEAADPSLDIGQKCDVNRFGTIPGFEGSYSMDCSPTVKTSDGPGNAFGGTFTSSGYQVAITDASPSCSDPKFAGQKCFCGMCPDGVKACQSNADCGGAQCGALPAGCNPNPAPLNDDGTANTDFDPTFAVAQCRGTGTTTLSATRPNSCRGGACNWNPDTGLGTCMSVLGNQTVGCYPSGVGASVKAPGRRDRIGGVYIVDTATARCTRAQAPVVNGQLGLPGLTFQKRSFRITPEFAK
jgi:hypothetical protein